MKPRGEHFEGHVCIQPLDPDGLDLPDLRVVETFGDAGAGRARGRGPVLRGVGSRYARAYLDPRLRGIE